MAQEPFGDIPLFRELQRLLASGSGPLNFEIARQVATAMAVQGSGDPSPDPSLQRLLSEAIHSAQDLVSGYTRLAPPEPAAARVVGRGWWASSTLEAWKWLLERLAGRFSEELARLGGEQAGEDNPMQAALGQLTPLLMGIQTGTLIGHLATESLGRYDYPIPRDDDGALFYVGPNVQETISGYGFDQKNFVTWLGLHDAARRLAMIAVPWTARYLRSLVIEVVDATELDVSDLERRVIDLQSQGMESLQEGLGPEAQLPIASTERHRRALDRLWALVAALEGYASHAAQAAGEQVIGADLAQISEGMARRRASPSEGESLLSTILGISVDRALVTSGRTFCAAVVELKGLAALNRMWEAPDNIPTTEEIKDPFAWMERLL
jgi:putative hydrolase